MLAILHVMLALLSITTTTYTAWKPTQTKLRTTYTLVAGTMITGIALTLSSPNMILQSCTMGLFYIGFTISTIKIAYRRLPVSA